MIIYRVRFISRCKCFEALNECMIGLYGASKHLKRLMDHNGPYIIIILFDYVFIEKNTVNTLKKIVLCKYNSSKCLYLWQSMVPTFN